MSNRWFTEARLGCASFVMESNYSSGAMSKPLGWQSVQAIFTVETRPAPHKWLPGEGVITENDPEEQQKRTRSTDILANALMLQHMSDLTEALQKLEQSGYPINPEDVVHLSSHLTRHQYHWKNRSFVFK
jgi:Tn3 transposase DDE domain